MYLEVSPVCRTFETVEINIKKEFEKKKEYQCTSKFFLYAAINIRKSFENEHKKKNVKKTCNKVNNNNNDKQNKYKRYTMLR